MALLLVAAGIFVFAIAVIDSIAIVKPFHFGIRRLLGYQFPGALLEGPHLKIPFIMGVQMASRELTTFSSGEKGTTFTTEDGLAMTAYWSLKVKADPEVMLPDGRITFFSMKEETITGGLNDTIEARLGALGGTVKGDDLKGKRHAVGDFFNCILRLKTAPHLDHVKGDSEKCGLGDKCPIKAIGPIPAEEVIEYYHTHFDHVKKQLEGADKQKSRTETLYGLSIELFDLATLAFSLKTQESLEEKKQAEQRAGALEEKLKLLKEVNAVPGMTPQIAINFVETTLTPKTTRQVISVEGEAGVLGGIVAGLAGRKEK